MLQLLETGRALYVLAAICLLGIVTRAVAKHLYKRLLKESSNLMMTKNKSLKELRQRAENTYRMNQGLRDSGAWLEHQLYELNVFGISLAGWTNLATQWTWLCLLLGGIGAFFSYWYRLDTYYIVMYGGGAVLMAMLTMLFDNGMNGGWREQLVVSLQDYLENVMCPRLARNQPLDGARSEQTTDRPGFRNISKRIERADRPEGGSIYETSGSEGLRAAGAAAGAGGGTAVSVAGGSRKTQARNMRRQSPKNSFDSAGEERESRPDIDYLKHSLEQMAASREKSRTVDENWLKDLGPEEVELIGDILKQYLA